MLLELVLDDLDYTLGGVRLTSGRNLRPQVDKLRTRTSPEGGTIAGLPRGARTLVIVVRRDNRRETSSRGTTGDTDGDVQNVVVRITGSKVHLLATPNVNVRRPDDRDARRTIAIAVRRDGTSVRALRLGLLRRRRVRAHVVVPRTTIGRADVDFLLVATVVAVDVVAIANHDHTAVVVDSHALRAVPDGTCIALLRDRLIDTVPVGVKDLTRRALIRGSRRRRKRSTLHRNGVLDVRADLRLEALRNDLDTTGDRTDLDTTRDLRDNLDLDLLPRRTNNRLLGRLRLPEREGKGLGLGDLPHRGTLIALPQQRIGTVRLPLDRKRLALGNLELHRPGGHLLPMHVTRGDNVTGEHVAGRVVLVLAENRGAALDRRDSSLLHLVGGQPVVMCQAVLHSRIVRREACDTRLRLFGAATETLGEDLGVTRSVRRSDTDGEDREKRDQDGRDALVQHLRLLSVVRDQEAFPDRMVVEHITTQVSHTATLR